MKRWRSVSIRSPALEVLSIGREIEDADGAWTRTLGLELDGALLVRPDQHVAFRATTGVADPSAALRAALDTVLGH